MASNYTGVPTATQSPSPAPGTYVAPILNLPSDGDTLNVSSVLQSFKALADWSAWASTMFAALKGVTEWVTTVSYGAGSVVVRPYGDVEAHVYLAIQNNLNSDPATTPTVWKRIDWSADDVASMGGVLVTGAGIVCSHGATSPGAYMLKFAGDTLRMITFRVDNAPVNNYTDIDLNGCAAHFMTAAYTASVTLAQTGSTSIGQLGVSLNSGSDKNVIRLMCYGNYALITGGYGATYSAFVTLLGA